VAADLADVGRSVVETVPSLPAAIVHDVLTAPVRDLAILGALARDTLELAVPPRDGAPRRLYGRTLRALHRSRVFSMAAGAVGRATAPGNRTARLAIVLTARAHGLPVEGEDLDRLRQAIDRDAPDLGPLVAGVVRRLAHVYGREAVRVLLLPG
jgi:hypothetical protein